LLTAATCSAALVLEGLIAFELPLARSLDARSLAGFQALTSNPRLYALASGIDNATPVAIALVGVLLVAVALIRRRPRVALAVPIAMAGAVGTTEVLKHLVTQSRQSPVLGWNQLAAGSWPSGHATAAMIAALCAVLVAPSRLRPVVALLGSAAVLAVSYSMLALSAHFPSDILGGFLVAGLWISLTLYALWRSSNAAVVPGAPTPTLTRIRAALVPACTALGVFVLLGIRAVVPSTGGAPVGGSLIAGACALAVVAALITGGLVAALQPQRRVGSTPTASRRSNAV
jgi:membrane-associated phospholipid phosphatase